MPFYFYTIILGIVIGAVFTWFLVADHPFESRETPGGPVDEVEAGVLATQMKSSGFDVNEVAVTKLLQLHGEYVVGYQLGEAHGEEAVSHEATPVEEAPGEEAPGEETTSPEDAIQRGKAAPASTDVFREGDRPTD